MRVESSYLPTVGETGVKLAVVAVHECEDPESWQNYDMTLKAALAEFSRQMMDQGHTLASPINVQSSLHETLRTGIAVRVSAACRGGAAVDEEQPRGCVCQRCGTRYVVDLLVPDELWEQLSNGVNLLCPRCIADGIVRVSDFAAYRVESLTEQRSTAAEPQSIAEWIVKLIGKPCTVGVCRSCGVGTFHDPYKETLCPSCEQAKAGAEE